LQSLLLPSSSTAITVCSNIATVQILRATLRVEVSEAGHLIELVRLQAVTRKEAKKATQGESPLVNVIAVELEGDRRFRG
jgi:hypothetical protein